MTVKLLCPHIIGHTSADYGNIPGVKLVMPSEKAVKEWRAKLGPDKPIIVRLQDKDYRPPSFPKNPERAATEYWDAFGPTMLAMSDPQVWFEDLNEVPRQDALALAQFEDELIDLADAPSGDTDDPPLRFVLVNAPAGCYEAEDWRGPLKPILERIRAYNDTLALGLHERVGRKFDKALNWHIGRLWFLAKEYADLPVFITEFAHDVAPTAGHGWVDTFGGNMELALESLEQADAFYQAKGNVKGVFVFTDAETNAGWKDYDTRPMAGKFREWYKDAPVVPPPAPGPNEGDVAYWKGEYDALAKIMSSVCRASDGLFERTQVLESEAKQLVTQAIKIEHYLDSWRED